ncbi:MAG: serine/threonine protein kinase, partial [Planctomycetota bacterium]
MPVVYRRFVFPALLRQSSTSSAIMTLKKLGPYRLIDILGRGGMGTVYRAEHEETSEVCAVKALAPMYASDEHFRN